MKAGSWAADQRRQSCMRSPNEFTQYSPHRGQRTSSGRSVGLGFGVIGAELIAARGRTRLSYGGPGGSNSRAEPTFHTRLLHFAHRRGISRPPVTSHKCPHISQPHRSTRTRSPANRRSNAWITARPDPKSTTPNPGTISAGAVSRERQRGFFSAWESTFSHPARAGRVKENLEFNAILLMD